VPWGPAAKGPDTGGEGVRDLWGALCGWEGDEMRLGIFPVHTMALPFGGRHILCNRGFCAIVQSTNMIRPILILRSLLFYT